MVNPDNSINSIRNDPKRSTDKSSEKPEGDVQPEKFREVYAVYEHRKPKDEFEELEEVLKKRRKEGKGLSGLFDKGQMEGDVVFSLQDKKGKSFDDATSEQDLASMEVEEGVESKPNNKNDFYLREATDIAQVNPLAIPQTKIEAPFQVEAPKPPLPTRNDLQEIIDKIVNQVYKLENAKTGETSIVIVLNKEGPLKEVGIKISEFDSSQKQLNITIDNLTQEAKTLLDRNESLLLLALERKGYQVQSFVTTTNVEILRLDKPDAPEKGKSGHGGSREQKEEETEE